MTLGIAAYTCVEVPEVIVEIDLDEPVDLLCIKEQFAAMQVGYAEVPNVA